MSMPTAWNTSVSAAPRPYGFDRVWITPAPVWSGVAFFRSGFGGREIATQDSPGLLGTRRGEFVRHGA